MMVQTYLDGRPPTFAATYDELVRQVQADPEAWAARASTRPETDAEIDPDFAAELERWRLASLRTDDATVAELTARLPALSVAELDHLRRKGVWDAIGAELKRRSS